MQTEIKGFLFKRRHHSDDDRTKANCNSKEEAKTEMFANRHSEESAPEVPFRKWAPGILLLFQSAFIISFCWHQQKLIMKAPIVHCQQPVQLMKTLEEIVDMCNPKSKLCVYGEWKDCLLNTYNAETFCQHRDSPYPTDSERQFQSERWRSPGKGQSKKNVITECTSTTGSTSLITNCSMRPTDSWVETWGTMNVYYKDFSENHSAK